MTRVLATRLSGALIAGVLATSACTGKVSPDADPNLIPPDGASPLLFAVNLGVPEIVELLLKAGADPGQYEGSENASPLHEAVGVGRLTVLRMLIPYTKDIDNGRDPDNNPLSGPDIWPGSALEFAASLEGREQYASVLLGAGAQATITALYRAVRLGSAEMVTMLLDAGAPMSVSADEKRTMVEVAQEAGHADIVKILEERSK